ncbi:MAG: hypothetical protein AAF638_11045 [Pseudomonadota bacterium]
MFSAVMARSILTVLKWIFWGTGVLYALASLSVWLRDDMTGARDPLLAGLICIAAGFVARFFAARLI